MLDAPAELFEQRPRAGGIRGVGAHEADELPLPGRADGAADGAFDRHRAPGAHLLGKRDRGRRPHRAHLDEELSADVARQQSGGRVVDRLDCRRVGENGDDRLGGTRQFGRRGGQRRAGVGDRLRLAGRTIPHGHAVPDLDQPLRDGRAHQAESGNTDVHENCSLPLVRDDTQSTRTVPPSFRTREGFARAMRR